MTTHSSGPLRVAALALAAVVLGSSVPALDAAQAQRADSASVDATYDPFEQNRVRASVMGGITSSRSDTYLRLGVGVGYYVVRGLEVGVDTDVWFLADPEFLNVTPGITYVVPLRSPIKPYLGPFYRHAFVFGEEDLDSLGGRAGVFFVSGRAYFGAGAVYEHWLGCDSSTFVDCDALYPEIVLAMSF